MINYLINQPNPATNMTNSFMYRFLAKVEFGVNPDIN